ncbi:probable E3 ubiquitin-protein ligase makorin-1 isoform X1 [Anser cygnoides]|uniref:probable E3 ubiquitin-protein ligase makorin-1 isoform X1 n=1 Tax=Anser cygnoides TaxID=8845 RepID=UPI0034D38784
MEPGSQMASGALRARGGCLRPLCRDFARGSCWRGGGCRFSHARKSAPVCRYFQSGACAYGERCSYQHVQEEPLPARSRHSPVPSVAPGHQGWRGAWRTSVPAVPRATRAAFRLPNVEAEEEEDDKEDVPALNNPPGRAVREEFIPAGARGAAALLPAGSHPRGLGLDPNSPDPREVAATATWAERSEVPAEQGAAAAPVPAAALRARSEAVVCGICMERVYEKALPEERLFGILPNCGHAFCLGCIRTWRRSRDFQSTVIKACPECRVTSSYYIPHKYWVSDAGEKEQLIESFKARTGKIRCKFFIQNRGRCPFRSDCIYLHELPGGRPPRRSLQRPGVRAELNPSPSESSDEEEDDFCLLEWAVTRALLEVDFLYSSYGHEMLFGDSSDSD